MKLPNWLFDIPVSDDQTLYVFGISEPGMEHEKAFRLALLRAKSLIALLTHPVVTSITDNYSKENQNEKEDTFITKYENLYKIESFIDIKEGALEIIDSCFNTFGEAIILVKHRFHLTENLASEHISIVADAYQVERQKQNRFETQERLILNGTSVASDSVNSDQYSYACYSSNNIFQIESIFNDEEIHIPYHYLRYTMEKDSARDEPENDEANKLSYGLWKSYSELIIKKIILLSQPFSANIRQIGDQYSDKNQILAREVSEAKPSFKLNKISIINNYLAIDLDYLNKPN